MAAEREGLRVLMTADTIGGVWPFAMELCTQLSRHGDRILLAAMGREPDAEQRAQAAAVDGVELYTGPYRLVWMREPWDDLEAAGQWLLELSRRFSPDIVHLNDLAHGGLPWSAPVLMTAHSCVCSWWHAVHRTAAPEEWERYRTHVATNLHAVDRVVTPTRAMLDALMQQYGPLPLSAVIHNGRTDMHVDAAKEPFVFAAGRLWDEAKNLAALLAIVPRIPWPVYLAGDPRHPDDGETVLTGASLLGRLPHADIRAWMARAAIYALPARYEPFGLSALEAAQAGCALVLGDIPSLREVWEDAALFVAPDDHDALAAALQRLIEDEALRTRMAQAARERARRYTPEAMAQRYRDAYLDLIARQQALEGRAQSPLPTMAGAHA